MGTELEITVSAPDRATALAAGESAVRALEQSEARLSTWRNDSELSGLNAAPDEVRYGLSPTLAAELSAARTCAAMTQGAFDPTVGALVRAWDLRGRGRVPNPQELAVASARTGYGKLQVTGAAAVKSAGVTVEEGAFGKGAGLGAALHVLQAAGVTAATLNLGGQTAGLSESVIRVAHPERRREPVLQLRVAAGSFATSGDSEQRKRSGAVVFGHLLDPRTGHPAHDFGTLGVWASDPLQADCLSTALFVMGPEAALAWAAEHPEIGLLILEPAGDRVRARVTGQLSGRVVWQAPSVDLVSSPW